MGKRSKIIVDTNIFIRVFRGDEEAKLLLERIDDQIAISIITYIELLLGAKTKSRIFDLNKQMRTYPVFHLNEAISLQTLSIVKLYTVQHSVRVADALIAATSLYYGLPLLTHNKKDFDYIKGLALYDIA